MSSDDGIWPDEQDDYIQEAFESFGDQSYAYTNFAVVLNWHPSQDVYRFDQGILKNLYLTTLPIHLDLAACCAFDIEVKVP